MKGDSSIFKIEEGVLVFNKEEARDIPEFKAIIIRDKGSEGDHDGRKKAFAFKELMFIHIFLHPSSLYRDLPDKERRLRAKEHAGLPDDWKEDNLIKAASDAYLRHLDFTSLYHSYVNANRGVYSIGEDLNFFNNRRDNIRKDLDKLYNDLQALPYDESTQEERARLNEDIERGINALQKIATSILNMSTSLPSAFENVQKLKEQLANEEDDGSEIRGGGTLGRREE